MDERDFRDGWQPGRLETEAIYEEVLELDPIDQARRTLEDTLSRPLTEQEINHLREIHIEMKDKGRIGDILEYVSAEVEE